VSAKLKNLSPKTVSILIGVLGFALILAGIQFLVLPQRHTAAQLGDEIASTRTQIVTARAQSMEKPKQTIRVSNLFKLAQAMPDRTDMTGIILQLQKTAKDSRVDLSAIAPSASAVGAGYTVQPIELTIDGNFYSLNRFLAHLRRLVTVHGDTLDARGRLLTVTRVSFGPAEGGFPALTASVSVNAFVYDPSSGLPFTTATTPTTGTTDTGSLTSASGGTP
jgi:Tfp pilus assembly protein PilO